MSTTVHTHSYGKTDHRALEPTHVARQQGCTIGSWTCEAICIKPLPLVLFCQADKSQTTTPCFPTLEANLDLDASGVSLPLINSLTYFSPLNSGLLFHSRNVAKRHAGYRKSLRHVRGFLQLVFKYLLINTNFPNLLYAIPESSRVP